MTRSKLRELARDYVEGALSAPVTDELGEVVGDLAEVIWESVTESVKEQMTAQTVDRAFEEMAARRPRHLQAGPGKPQNGRDWSELR
jgi:hypothetical protein